MDFNENIKEEVSSFVSGLQKLLPKRKNIVSIIQPPRPKLTRLCDIHAEAKSVFPKCFIGTKLVIMREIMDKVKLVQQYNYGQAKESHRYFSQLINKEMEPKNVEDGLLLDSTGSATATYNELLEENLELRITSRIKDLVSSDTEFKLEKERDKSVGSLSLSMKDVDPESLKVVGQWFQQMIPEFGVGMEVAYMPTKYPSKPEISLSTRYERSSFALSSTIGKSGFQVCFFKQFAPDLRIATIVHDASRGFGSSSVPPTIGIAIHKDYDNGSELKLFVDSEKCGGFTFQKDVLFHESANDVRLVRILWSALLDRQRRVRFGFGFNLDF